MWLFFNFAPDCGSFGYWHHFKEFQHSGTETCMKMGRTQSSGGRYQCLKPPWCLGIQWDLESSTWPTIFFGCSLFFWYYFWRWLYCSWSALHTGKSVYISPHFLAVRFKKSVEIASSFLREQYICSLFVFYDSFSTLYCAFMWIRPRINAN